MSQLRWALADSLGRLLAPIDQYDEDSLELAVNDIRTGTIKVSLEDPVVPLVESMSTRLKAWLNNEIVLNAPIFLPDHKAGAGSDADTLTISATDNLRLATKFTLGFPVQTAVNQSEIMALLMEHADPIAAELASGIPSHGIIRGSLAASVLRDRSYYDLSNIWELLLDLTQVIDGPDFELRPLDREDGVFAEFTTYFPRQGSDLSDSVILEYGVGANNATDFGWQPSGEQLVNRYIMAGATPEGAPTTPAWISENLDSQRLYGIYEGTEVDPEISEMATLKEHADGVVASRAFPLDFFTVQPAVLEQDRDEVGVGVPPRFGPPGDDTADFWLGDTIGTIARKGRLDKRLAGRVIGATLSTADSAGNVAVAITFAVPAGSAGVTGREAALTLAAPVEIAGSESTVPTEEPATPEGEAAPPPPKSKPKRRRDFVVGDPISVKPSKKKR